MASCVGTNNEISLHHEFGYGLGMTLGYQLNQSLPHTLFKSVFVDNVLLEHGGLSHFLLHIRPSKSYGVGWCGGVVSGP